MGRKNHNKDKDWTEIQQLKAENYKLRRQIGKLRKVISRIDLEQYLFVRDLIDSQERQDEEFDRESKKAEIKGRWKCYDCDEGILKMVVVMKAGEQYYIRKCNSCGKKTKLKKLVENVDKN